MQKLLRYFFNLTILLLAILLWPGLRISVAQISITGVHPLEIRFSLDSSQRSQTSVTVNLSDWNEITIPEFHPLYKRWSSFGPEAENDVNIFVQESRQHLSPGRVKSADNIQSYFTVSLKNSSDSHLGSMLAAFDFVYNPAHIVNNETLSLKYRVNDTAWRNADGGTIQTSQLPDGDEEWKSFSLQMNIDNIYLRQDDLLHLMWVTDDNRQQSNGTLFLQRIEVYPEASSVEKLQRGSLIITEIMPETEVDGTLFEYIEIYNPDNRAVRLKGVEVTTSKGSYVIQHDVAVPPYGMFVLSNIDISGLEGVSDSYFYSANLFPGAGGRIELIQQHEVIAVATYEAGESGVALQLDQISNAFDGYTSLTNLIPSDQSFFPELSLSGSPGQLGRTIPIYRRTIEREGWHLIAPPGKFHNRLNRHNNITFYTIDGEEISAEMAEPFSPLFIYKEGSEALTLHVEAVPVPDPTLSLVQNPISSGSYLTTNLKPTQLSVAQILRNSEYSVPPLVKVWDEAAGKFQLRRTDDTELLDWTPFILPFDVNENSGTSQNRSGLRADISRQISFSLFDGEGNSKKLIDRAILGFMQNSSGSDTRRFDLGKLQTEFNNPGIRERTDASFLYLTSPESDASLNSFLHIPYEITEDYSVGLGYEFASDQTSGNAAIEWRLPSDIPDEWVIALRDVRSGTTIDMREESAYRFRYTVSQKERELDDTVIKLGVPQPAERSRFMIEIQPYETIIEAEEEETMPGSVELRQNYPNPFNPSTNINFYLPEERAVKVGIYNIVGQQVAVLLDENMQAGEHSVIWDASNNPSGIYIVQLETGSRIFTRKITLIK